MNNDSSGQYQNDTRQSDHRLVDPWRNTFSIAFALLLGGWQSGGTSNTINGWAAYFSPGVSLVAAPGALFSVSIPAATSICPNAAGTCPRLGYVQEAAPKLQPSQTVTLTGSVQASADAVFNYTTNPDNPTTASGHPSSCRIWFQEAGDNGSGTGVYAYYRWWAN